MKLKELDNFPLASVQKSIYEDSLIDFVRWVFREIYSREFVENWHFVTICQILEKIYRGELKNVVITIPPRYSKTELVVICFVSWCFAKNKNCEFLHVSYSDTLVMRNSNKIRRIIFSPEFYSFWGIRPDKREQAKKIWSIEGGGGLYVASRGGAVTGFGGGIRGAKGFSGAVLIDDPQKANEERFELARKTVIENFENVIASRKNAPDAPIILIQQRLHEEDLAGHLISGRSAAGKFELIRLPAIMDGPKNQYDCREIGEPLWGAEHNLEALETIKNANPTLFAGQYQQRPAPLSGNMIKKEWLNFYNEMPENISPRVFISCDLNFKKEGTSNVAISCYGVFQFPDRRKVYLLDQVCKKLDFPETEDCILAMAKKWGYEAILIEDAANGAGMVSTLLRAGADSVIPISPRGLTKIERLARVTGMYRGGDVYYPAPKICPWVEEHIHEMIIFPNGKYDDRVDAESQFLNYFKHTMTVPKFINI